MSKPNEDAQVTNKMGTQPLMKLIISMSLPAMFSMMVQSLYNIIDSMFVAKIGQDALTAINLAYPIQMLMISVAIGTAVGINSLVSRRLGEGNVAEASKAATHGLLLGAISAIVFAILGIFFTEPFFKAFTNDANVIEMGTTYIKIVTIFSFGVFLQINIEKTLQATGNMIYPMLFQLTGAITNIILDPIMIFGWFGFPAMGMAGAAVATVIGQIVAMVFSMIIIHVKSHDVHMKLKGFRPEMKTIKDIYAVGFPAIVMNSIGSVLTTAVNGILTGFGATAVNVFGAYFKIQSFVFMPVFGLTQGIMPILGFNFGAQKKKRIVGTLKIGMIVAIAMMAAGTLMFMVIPDKLLMIFNADEQMIKMGSLAFRILSIGFIPAAIGIISSTLFQAVGMGNRSLFISVMRQLVIILPLAYLFSFLGLGYVWVAFNIADIAAMVISIILMRNVIKTKFDFN